MLSIALTLHEEDLSIIDKSVDNGVSDRIISEDLIKLPKR